MGAFAGLLAATKGGWFDQLMGRVADVIMSVPSLIFALLMLSIFGTDLSVIVIVVAIIYSPRVFRLTRAVAGNVVVMDYIEAAKLRGEGDWYLIRKEILPNSTAPLIAEFGLEFCFVFLLIAGLSLPRPRHSAADRRLGLDGARECDADLVRRHHAADPGRRHRAADGGGQLRRRLDAVPVLRPEGALR